MLIPGAHIPCSGKRAWPGTRCLRLRNSMSVTLLLVTLFLVISPFARICRGGTYSVEQDQVKAVYVYNFLHVVHWPGNGRLAETESAMVIGVLGAPSPFSAALDELAENVKKRKSDPIRIVHLGAYQDGMNLSGCRIVFVCASERGNFTKIISSLKKTSVLTVADSDDFLAAGGMIVLVEQKNRVRYRINRQATSDAGLRLSSQLLQSALSVDGG